MTMCVSLGAAPAGLALLQLAVASAATARTMCRTVDVVHWMEQVSDEQYR